MAYIVKRALRGYKQDNPGNRNTAHIHYMAFVMVQPMLTQQVELHIKQQSPEL